MTLNLATPIVHAGVLDRSFSESQRSSETKEAPNAIIGYFVKTQTDLNKWINKTTVSIKEDRSTKTLLLATLFSFIYGVLHAAGPGHAKTVVASYFLSKNADYRYGFWMALRIGVTHMLAAVVTVVILKFILDKSLLSSAQETKLVGLVSYGLITLIGLFLFFRNIRQFITGKEEHHCCNDPHHKHDHHRIDIKSIGVTKVKIDKHHKQGWFLSVGAGLIPCPGPILILLYAAANNILWFGVAMTMVMAIGMTVTISAVGVISILMRKKSISIAHKHSEKLGVRVATGLGLLGSLTIILIGGLLFASYLI